MNGKAEEGWIRGRVNGRDGRCWDRGRGGGRLKNGGLAGRVLEQVVKGNASRR